MITMLKRLLAIALFIVPFLIITKPIFSGAIPFWYDPGRDLLMAWDNLNKISLIGPPTGIPGIFYGPYWIWLLSLGLLVSKDPRVVLFLCISIPYFIGIPLIIRSLNKSLVDKITISALWIISIFSFASYISQIWNPNLAPLLLFILLTLFYKTKDMRLEKNVKRFVVIGLVYGLLFNQHISIGVVILLTWGIYFLLNLLLTISNKKKIKDYFFNWLTNVVSFWIGFFIILLPFFIFEARHGFMQIKSLIYTLSKSSAVVSQVGLTKIQIVQNFIERSSIALSLPSKLSLFIVVVIVGGIVFNLSKKKIYSKDDLKLLLFLILNVFSLFVVYLGTKNPVWAYHFISAEVIFIFLILLAIKKNRFLEYIFLFWALVILISQIIFFSKSFSKHTNPGELMAKKSNVEFILKDTKNFSYMYYAKNPSIYTYDYDYLFRWVGEEEKKYSQPSLDKATNIYIIVPYDVRNDKVGFTLNRTPDNQYYTSNQWIREDGTIIIKRLHKK